jgi:SSS family solute:Na+ symporter
MAMFGLDLIDIVIVVIYFVVVIAIGIWASRRIENQEDFFLAGRRFGKFIQTFAAFGQGTSTETGVAVTVQVARNGLAGLWKEMVYVFFMPLLFIFSGWYRRMRCITMGDFFEERYNSKKFAGFYALTSSAFFMIVIGLGFIATTKTISGILIKPVDELSTVQRAEYEKAVELEHLEDIDSEILTVEQTSRMEQLRLEKPVKEFSHINDKVLMWCLVVIVIVYTTMGGLEAAFLSDTLQGFCIMILSFLLIPFAFSKINMIFGGSGLTGVLEASKARLPEVAFEIWGSPAMVDFTWYYMITLWIVWQFNIFVLPNQLTTTGSAKDEMSARIGFTTGIHIKRTFVLLWGITSILLLILYGGIIKNPDYLYGYACRDLLGSLGIGLTGLMIACLMAATMSTADAMMITAASLATKNLFRPFFPNLSERQYIWVGRFFGVFVVLGGAMFAIGYDNVYLLLKLLWEFYVVTAAAFFLGLKWRRATIAGAWCSAVSTAVLFFGLGVLVPLLPGVRTNEYLQKTVEPIAIVRTYTVRQVDVEKRIEKISHWDKLNEKSKPGIPRPEPLVVGQKFETKFNTPKQAIFWDMGLVKEEGQVRGAGMLNIGLLTLDWMGFDLSKNPYALNETLRLIIRGTWPFFLLIVVSLMTKPCEKDRLDRLFVKMKTPVVGDSEEDKRQMALSYENPQRFDYKKLFPNSNWEFEKLDRVTIKGILSYGVWQVAILVVFFLIVFLGR